MMLIFYGSQGHPYDCFPRGLIYMYLYVCVCHICVCVVHLVKESVSFLGVWTINVHAHNRTHAQALVWHFISTPALQTTTKKAACSLLDTGMNRWYIWNLIKLYMILRRVDNQNNNYNRLLVSVIRKPAIIECWTPQSNHRDTFF